MRRPAGANGQEKNPLQTPLRYYGRVNAARPSLRSAANIRGSWQPLTPTASVLLPLNPTTWQRPSFA